MRPSVGLHAFYEHAQAFAGQFRRAGWYGLAMAERQEIPLFPLGNVLFSGGRLPLQIFEPRYADLVGRCMKTNTGFGVVLIREGRETFEGGGPPSLFNVGTYASIIDFNQLANGLLGIVCVGASKFRIHRSWAAADHLVMAEVEFLEEERAGTVAPEFQPLVETLRVLAKHPMIQQLKLDIDYDDARSVSWRLAELLPLEPETKQSLLQMQLPRERLVEIGRLVAKLKG